MNGRLTVALVVASMIAVSSSPQTLAQAAAAGAGERGQRKLPPTTEVGPCVAAPMSSECAVSRLNGIDRRLDGIDQTLRDLDAAVRDLQARSGRSALGPPIELPAVADSGTNANSEYLQRQIDGLSKTVKDLVVRVNAATANK